MIFWNILSSTLTANNVCLLKKAKKALNIRIQSEKHNLKKFLTTKKIILKNLRGTGFRDSLLILQDMKKQTEN